MLMYKMNALCPCLAYVYVPWPYDAQLVQKFSHSIISVYNYYMACISVWGVIWKACGSVCKECVLLLTALHLAIQCPYLLVLCAIYCSWRTQYALQEGPPCMVSMHWKVWAAGLPPQCCQGSNGLDSTEGKEAKGQLILCIMQRTLYV